MKAIRLAAPALAYHRELVGDAAVTKQGAPHQNDAVKEARPLNELGGGLGELPDGAREPKEKYVPVLPNGIQRATGLGNFVILAAVRAPEANGRDYHDSRRRRRRSVHCKPLYQRTLSYSSTSTSSLQNARAIRPSAVFCHLRRTKTCKESSPQPLSWEWSRKLQSARLF